MLARASCCFRSVLAPVDDDEIRLQRQDPLDVRIEQRSDARQLLHLGRIGVEAADGDDLRTCADARTASR